MMMRLGILALCLTACATAPLAEPLAEPSAEEGRALDSLRWMLGTWRAVDGDGMTTESWEAVSPATFEGRGETRPSAGAEPTNSESLRLVEMSGEVFYMAKVGHNALPVAFRLVSRSDDGAVFENPGHDFPKRLEYRLVGDRGLVVAVTGGGDGGFEIRFTRERGSR